MKYVIALLVVIALVLFVDFSLEHTEKAKGAATDGLYATQAVATTTEVGPQQTKTLFAENKLCTSRIIRTQGQEIYLLFADPTNGDLASTTLAINAGFLQSASTTVAYDGGLYGCGRVTAEALASTTITNAEMR